MLTLSKSKIKWIEESKPNPSVGVVLCLSYHKMVIGNIDIQEHLSKVYYLFKNPNLHCAYFIYDMAYVDIHYTIHT